MKDIYPLNVNVRYVHSLDIPWVQWTVQFTPLVLEYNSFTVSSPMGRFSICTLCWIQFSFLIPQVAITVREAEAVWNEKFARHFQHMTRSKNWAPDLLIRVHHPIRLAHAPCSSQNLQITSQTQGPRAVCLVMAHFNLSPRVRVSTSLITVYSPVDLCRCSSQHHSPPACNHNGTGRAADARAHHTDACVSAAKSPQPGPLRTLLLPSISGWDAGKISRIAL